MDLHLVDGTYELFRMHFGAPGATTPDGREVGAVRGMLRTLWKLLTKESATHVAVAFDHVIESFRNDLFDGYKTGDGIDPDLWTQAPLAERAAHALGLTVWPAVYFEADDLLASGAARWADHPDMGHVYLCSPDKDLMQCVGPNVSLLDRRREQTIDAAGVREKFGVGPASIPDYLALVGDSADGIPGLPRWGAKSTATVLAHYEHLEAIPDDPQAWAVKVRGGKALAGVLAANRGDAQLYKLLATLRTDAPIPQPLEKLRWRGARRDALEALCEEIGDRRFCERVTTWR